MERMELHDLDPEQRFSRRADAYRRYRPDYPAEAIDFVTGLAEGLIVDLGAGTGIATNQMAERGRRVIAVEPNAEMRAAGRLHENASWLDAAAEQTGLERGSAGIVTAFQAFHWFDPERALPEIVRLLGPEGAFAAVWNERDDRDSFTAAYGNLVRRVSHNHPAESRLGTAERITSSDLFERVERRTFSHRQELDADGLVGRAASTSYLPAEGEEHESLLEELHALFSEYAEKGRVALRYETVVHVAWPTQR